MPLPDTDTDYSESRGSVPPATPLPTGEWGRPPRPQPHEPLQHGRTRTHLRRFFPPPPPPPPASLRGPVLTRRRVRSAVAELVVAAAVIASVALWAGGSAPHRSVDPRLQWNSRALPVLTVLVGDLTELQSDSLQPGTQQSGSQQSGDPALVADTSRLQRDVAAARTLSEPTRAGIGQSWSVALVYLDAVVSAADHLEAASGGDVDRQSTLESLQTAINQAGQSLLRLASAMRA